MHTLLAFAVTLVAITVVSVRYRVPPFLTLIGGAVLYGLLAGSDPAGILPTATVGAGKVFATLGIIIFAGSSLAALLRESRHLDRIFADIQALVPSRAGATALAGYLLAIPLMCCVTSFMILSPLVARVEEGGRVTGKRLLYILAAGSVLSFVLVYPSPVVLSLLQSPLFTGTSPWEFTLLTIPLSLLLLAALTLLLLRWHPEPEEPTRDEAVPAVSSLRAWAPVLTPIVLVVAGLTIPGLEVLSDVNGAMIAALIVAALCVPAAVRLPGLTKGTRNAGIIIFDLCGAGALGAVIASTPFADQAFQLASGFLPVILVPFALAALLQAALGSRVVTAIVAASVLAGSAAVASIPPLALLLILCGGILVCSYLTDPYFWLIHRVTGDSVAEVARYYTVPLALAGTVVFLAGLGVSVIAGAG
ncbi:MAG: hypothetical protein LUQ64_02440 [Methanomicrobiales archaeon]|nr:hypothetical protein [Methanomicrobiales archaeon]